MRRHELQVRGFLRRVARLRCAPDCQTSSHTGDGMSHTPAQQWSILSALYEEADNLPAHELPGWLARLEREAHPLLPQLRSMLDARTRMRADDFLGSLPLLSKDPLPASNWAAGRKVGPYRLVRPLGEGGMAEVWLAERDDGAFKRRVAIKLPYARPGRETFAVRFDRERDILATLRHPHIAALYDAGVTSEGQAWLALEYVEGEAIAAYCDARRLGVRERVQLFRQVLLAVQHAHANLVIHRDLKPANILVTPQGEVRLLDFGIAKLLESQGDAIGDTELTREAGRTMTPRYASPEQLTGQPLTIACDVYSLGVVLYELLSGQRPYDLKIDSALRLEHAILEEEPRAMSRRPLDEVAAQVRGTTVKGLRRALSPELDAVALHCLAKLPSRRYSSVDALLTDVDRWLAGETVLARAPGAWYRLAKFALRHRLGVGLGVAAVLALAGVATIAVVLGLQARQESARAVAARDFMLSLFKRADQEKARGADITARELLETGRKDLLTRLADQPSLQAELLHGIATIQKDMGEYVGADSTFADTARIYTRLGMPREAALARTAQADAAVRMGDMRLAESALDEARKTPGMPRDDPQINAEMDEVEGWIAFAHREPLRARDFFGRSYDEAVKAFGMYNLKTMDALRGRVYAERELRNFDDAMRLLEQLEAIASKTSGVSAISWAALARDRADLLMNAGHFAESLDRVQVAWPKCVSALGPNHPECRELLFRKTSALLRLGMARQASADLAALEAIANDRKSPALGVDTLLLILQIDSAVGTAARRNETFERLKALVESDSLARFGPSFTARAMLALAESALRAHDSTGAEHWIARAKAIQRRKDGAVASTKSEVLAETLEGVSLLQRGLVDEALRSLNAVRSDMSRLFGPDDPMTCLLSLNLAQALRVSGDIDEAVAVADHAEPILRKAMGTQSPVYLRARTLLDDLQQSASRDVGSPGKGATASAKRGKSGSLSGDFFT